MKLERARGTRDFAAGDALLRQQIVTTLRSVFELYGYNPLETPILERFETLASKYAGGEEILKETFRLKDQGGRELGMRYDLTVPMCRFIATNPNLKMPFKRYQIGVVFRDGPLKTGRYREFMQCDVDIVGVKSMEADAEMVQIALAVFEKLGLEVVVRINSRKILDATFLKSGIPKDKFETVILSLDKLLKIGRDEVKKELENKGISKKEVDKLFGAFIGWQGGGKSNIEELNNLRKILGNNEGIEEINEILNAVNDERVLFSSTLARGLAYYTGTVFEVFLKGKAGITSAVAAGGRYDKMIGNFVGGNREYPAVGISFGLDVITDALKLTKAERTVTITKVLIASIGKDKEAAEIAKKLRDAGVNCATDFSGKAGKAIEYANYYLIPYVAFVGAKEGKEKATLRNMESGKEELLAANDLIRRLG
ncbi:histidine--tRNA ligase [Candidatus Woesearchaeota archaeon]|nr:histidine--tRNA ligase [Candidatus Woesearchaeota archaeon]